MIYQPVPWPDRHIYAVGHSNNLIFDASLGDWGLGRPLVEKVNTRGEAVDEAKKPRALPLGFTERDDDSSDPAKTLEDRSALDGDSDQYGTGRSSNLSDVAQPDPMNAQGLDAPARVGATPENEGGSGLSPLELTLIVIGVVAMALVAALLAKIRLRRLDF